MLNLSLPATNRFASNYLKQTPEIQQFFHYRFNHIEDDQDRLAELRNRAFPRLQMAEHIQSYMSKFPSSPEVLKSIEKLRQTDSTVVIGGQQAGILTGPLYTIHKVISIVKLAEQKELELGIPVVPVFWIAGEDHDYHEVNHVFVPVGQKADKWVYPERIIQKKMISDISLDKAACVSWAKSIIENFGETKYTKSVLDFIDLSLVQSESFVDFFATIIMELFKDKGLLIVDSGNPEIRHLEKEILLNQIHHHHDITDALLKQQKEMSKFEYPVTIEVKNNAANLFYYDHRFNERILLEYDRQKDQFVGKSGAVCFTKEELVEITKSDPGKLSNNVVTRPLTQEWLFPTLAFIAGPGEISYWAELKQVFEKFDIKMPPIVPRLNITLLDRSVETHINELGIQLFDVLKGGTEQFRRQFLNSVKDTEIDDYFAVAKEKIFEQYALIEGKIQELDRGLLPLLKKNEELLIKQIEFMESKVEASHHENHRVVLNKYGRIDAALRPNGFPQERVWNIFYYLNHYGLDLIQKLMQLDYEFDGSHKIIKM